MDLILGMGFEEFDSLHASVFRLHLQRRLEQAEAARVAQAPNKEYQKWSKQIRSISDPPQAKKKGGALDFQKMMRMKK